MSRKNRNNDSNRYSWNEIDWVINNLTNKDLEIIEKSPESVSNCLDFLDEFIDSGADIKINHNDNDDCFEMKIMFYEKGFTNSGFAISSRGQDFLHCLRICIYKINNVAKGDLSTLYEAREKRPKYG